MAQGYMVCRIHGDFDEKFSHCPHCGKKLKHTVMPIWLVKGALVNFHPLLHDPEPVPVRVLNDPTPSNIAFERIGNITLGFRRDFTGLAWITKLDLSRFQSCPTAREWDPKILKKMEAEC